ncbi:MAG: hypothetical protein KKF44_07145 [Nanoarchaeota archaeon]|nr:hypothetical protein [Nanoarchaeota archaeon]
MPPSDYYDNYPYSSVILANSLQIAVYAIGAYILYLVGTSWVFLYLIYIILLEIRLLRISCVNCYYYGKRCFSGKGRLCSILFKKGQPKKFIKKKLSWKDIVPDLFVSLIPLLTGLVLLIKRFDWILLGLLVVLFFLTSVGNSFVRGSLACKHCKQRKLGCPAEKLFAKKNKSAAS